MLRSLDATALIEPAFPDNAELGGFLVDRAEKNQDEQSPKTDEDHGLYEVCAPRKGAEASLRLHEAPLTTWRVRYLADKLTACTTWSPLSVSRS